MYEKFQLGADKAREVHTSIISDVRGHTLTLTLRPYYNSFPVNEQYRKFSNDIKKLFIEIEAYYNTLMISFEFTKDYNIHAHLYFTTEVEDLQLFEQNFKKCKRKFDSIGINYKLKPIGGLQGIEDFEALNNYPFKDIERTLKYSKLENVLFKPFHYVKRCHNTGSLRSPKAANVGNINIDKFLKFATQERNYFQIEKNI